jgi:methylenetetrahydrofolate--tRNA-(uracil-5-)-methyltransferase
VESAASGLLAGLELAQGSLPAADQFPPGNRNRRLAAYVSDSSVNLFQPMNVNFGIIPPLSYRVRANETKTRSLQKERLKRWIKSVPFWRNPEKTEGLFHKRGVFRKRKRGTM